MNKQILIFLSTLLVTALFTACGITSNIEPSATEKPVEPHTTPYTEATVPKATSEPTPTETEDVQYEGDASSYYIDVVYAQQIDRYYTALSEKWDDTAYLDHDMSALAARYYEENPLDNVGFTFMDLDGDGIWELIIGAISAAEQDPLVFEIWALKDGEPVMLAQSGYHNRYYLQYAQEDDLWSVAYEAENGAANHAVYYLNLVNGEFQVIQGVIFDMIANEKAPWFMAYDLDWDVSNDMPISEDTANAVINAGRNTYSATEYFPYCLYR